MNELSQGCSGGARGGVGGNGEMARTDIARTGQNTLLSKFSQKFDTSCHHRYCWTKEFIIGCWSGASKVKIKVTVKIAFTAKILPDAFQDFSGNGGMLSNKNAYSRQDWKITNNRPKSHASVFVFAVFVFVLVDVILIYILDFVLEESTNTPLHY